MGVKQFFLNFGNSRLLFLEIKDEKVNNEPIFIDGAFCPCLFSATYRN